MLLDNLASVVTDLFVVSVLYSSTDLDEYVYHGMFPFIDLNHISKITERIHNVKVVNHLSAERLISA